MSNPGAQKAHPRVPQEEILKFLRKLRMYDVNIPKVRIGSLGDGGYVIPDDLAHIKGVISIGIGGEVSFDQHFADLGLKVYQYDHTVDGPPVTHKNFLFNKVGWNSKAENGFTTLSEILDANNLYDGDCLLKFDVEGAEWDALVNVSTTLLQRFRIIVCELHRFAALEARPFFQKAQRAINILTENHKVVHVHPNNCCGIELVGGIILPKVAEFTFIRTDRGSFARSTAAIPSALDCPNLRNRPEIVLTPFHLDLEESEADAQAPPESRLNPRFFNAPLLDATDVRRRVRRVLSAFKIETEPGNPGPGLIAFLAISGISLSGRTVDESGTKGGGPFILWLRIDNPAGASLRDLNVPIEQRLEALSSELKARLRSDQSLLVLDWSHEGSPVNAPLLGLGEALRNWGFPPSRTILLTQNRILRDTYLQRLLAGREPLHIVPAHSYLSSYWEMVCLGNAAGREFEQRVGFATEGDQTRRYRYICLNYHLRPARAIVVTRLLQRPESGWISFDASRLRTYIMENPSRLWEEIRGLSLPEESAINEAMVRSVIDEGLAIQPDDSNLAGLHQAFYGVPVSAFRESELYIVTESEMSAQSVRRFTEKTLKAIVAGIPFIVFGNPGTVEAFAQMGFDTLGDFVDHSYDSIEDPAHRLATAWREVERFLSRPAGFSVEELQRLRSASNHNRGIFETQMPLEWILPPLAEVYALMFPDKA